MTPEERAIAKAAAAQMMRRPMQVVDAWRPQAYQAEKSPGWRKPTHSNGGTKGHDCGCGGGGAMAEGYKRMFLDLDARLQKVEQHTSAFRAGGYSDEMGIAARYSGSKFHGGTIASDPVTIADNAAPGQIVLAWSGDNLSRVRMTQWCRIWISIQGAGTLLDQSDGLEVNLLFNGIASSVILYPASGMVPTLTGDTRAVLLLDETNAGPFVDAAMTPELRINHGQLTGGGSNNVIRAFVACGADCVRP